MKIAIGTTSELKVRALKNALEKFGVNAEIVSIKTESGISNQPFGYKEMIKGAKNRATKALEETDSDFAFGVENGLVEIEGDYFDIACIYVLSKEGDESTSYSSGVFTPKWMIDEVKEENTEIGEIIKKLVWKEEKMEKDPIKYFSDGKIRREELLSQAMEMALVKIFNKQKYIKHDIAGN